MTGIVVTYQLWGDPSAAEDRATAIAVEQTHEFPTDLAPKHTRESLGRVLRVDQVDSTLTHAVIEYPTEVAGAELPQLLVLLFGNVSLLPDVRLVDLSLPPDLLASFPGPGYGIAGLRELFSAPTRPLLATALKPIGLDAAELAEIAYDFAHAGIDLIKDDQSLANQHWAPFRERVQRVGEAVRRANDETGGRTIYAPALNFPVSQFAERVELAVEAGAGGFLALPGVHGFDLVTWAGRETGLPIFAHPTLLGSFLSPQSGISHRVLLGELMRLAGADASIFPNHGGRFSFTVEQCLDVVRGCRRPIEDLEPIFPTPGGGMPLARIPEMIDLYGRDVMLLIGGELFRGDRRDNAAEFRDAVEAL